MPAKKNTLGNALATYTCKIIKHADASSSRAVMGSAPASAAPSPPPPPPPIYAIVAVDLIRLYRLGSKFRGLGRDR